MDRPTILCVDDEPNVLRGLRGHLRKLGRVLVAAGGSEGLALLAEHPQTAVVVSDMRMPGMDGAAFLQQARATVPEAVRVLLTGYADLESAVRAVNEAEIFRFLTKPIPPNLLREAIQGALRQHRLIRVEQELLQQTLRRCVRAMSEILGLASPEIFGRAERVKERVCALAQDARIEEPWALEVAAILSQLGMVTLPEALVHKIHEGEPLTSSEEALALRVPEAALELLAEVPRLEEVLALLSGLMAPAEPEDSLELGLLRMALDLDALEASGLGAAEAVAIVARRTRYPSEALRALEGRVVHPEEVIEASLSDLLPGMVLHRDLRTTSDILLLSRGQVITTNLIRKLWNMRSASIQQPVLVLRREQP